MTRPIRVVTFGHDSIDTPIRGGEQRSHWIHRIYLEHAKEWNLEPAYRHEARFLAYFRPHKQGLRAALSPFEAAVRRIPKELTRELGRRPKTAAALRDRLAEDERLVEEAHLVHFEHPFAYPFLEGRLAGKRVIYSSHNIESEILLEYFRRNGSSPKERDELLRRIARVEGALVRRADLVLACSERDARHYRAIGGQEVRVALNGALPVLPTEGRLQTGVPFERYAIFVSSAWNPNVSGLIEYCGNLEAPRGSGLVCAGSISDSSHPGLARLRENRSIHFTGPVEAERFAALVAGARGFAVPTLDSGGSNIKTAEALLTKKPIVATKGAFRGYEAFADSAGIRICETAAEFQEQVQECLDAPEREYHRPEAAALRWPNALQPAAEAIRELVTRRPAAPPSEHSDGL